MNSLREEVGLWKTKFQEQVEVVATSAPTPAAAPNRDSAVPCGGGDADNLEKALQDAALAHEEASRWKEKAVATQELERELFVCLCGGMIHGARRRCLMCSCSSSSVCCCCCSTCPLVCVCVCFAV